MKHLLILSMSLVASRTYDEEPCDCGRTNPILSSRIIGGEETSPNEYPWMAYVKVKRTLCGGAIISSRHILTAAHCTEGVTRSAVLVRVGVHNSKQGKENTSQTLTIDRILIHPSFRKSNWINDISILVTEEEIILNQNVSLLCLPTSDIELLGQDLLALGWGRQVSSLSNKGPVNNLRQVSLSVVSPDLCTKYWSTFKLDGHQICLYGGENKDTCKGDSGGPTVWYDVEVRKYTLVGLISYGDANCGAPKPSVATNVSPFLDWIVSVVYETKPRSRACVKEDNRKLIGWGVHSLAVNF